MKFDILYESIIEGYGSKSINLFMSLIDLEFLLQKYKFGEEYSTQGSIYGHDILLLDSILIRLTFLKDISEAEIFSISFLGAYKGKFLTKNKSTNNAIGIGSTIAHLCDLYSDIGFDENYIFVDNYTKSLIIRIDNSNNTIYSMDDIKRNRVVEIIIDRKK